MSGPSCILTIGCMTIGCDRGVCGEEVDGEDCGGCSVVGDPCGDGVDVVSSPFTL